MASVRSFTIFASLTISVATPLLASAQSGVRPLSRAEAALAARRDAPALKLARADTMIATAELLSSRLRPDPSLGLGYSKSPPNYHLTLDLPIDLPGVRGLRIRSADAQRAAAALRFNFAEANAVLAADTSYTRALMSGELARLSRQNADDADSLRRIAIRRMEAGDAAAMDVELATIFAGQQSNQASADSLANIDALLLLQSVIGLNPSLVQISLSDSLTLNSETTPSASADPLSVQAATSELAAADFLVEQRRKAGFPWPSLQLGLDFKDPDIKGVMPVVGLAFPLPIFSGNKGEVAVSRAQRDRTAIELANLRLEVSAAIAQTTRQLAAARARVMNDLRLQSSTDRVASMSLTAYREGASSISNVMEAQRTVRDARAQYLRDLADVAVWSATLRTITAAAPLESQK